MFGSFNETVERALQADGYVPAGLDCVWIGDEFVWESGYVDGHKLMYLRVVDLEAHEAGYHDESGVFHENIIVHIVAVDQDGFYKMVKVSTSHTTWIRQCEKNKRELFDIAESYAQNLETS